MDLFAPSLANSSPLTTLGFLDRAASAYGDSPSIVYNNANFTWSQTHRRCLQMASSLTSLGIQRGQVVSVVAPNVPSMYELQFAVPMSGAVLNNINTRLDARTLSVLLQHSESKLVFVDHQHGALVLDAIARFPRNVKHPLVVLIDDDGVSPSTVDFLDSYEGVLENGDPKFKWVRPKSEWDPMVLNYTSGTSSAPKGVVHSHRGAFILTMNSIIDWTLPNHPVYLWTLPMFHANGWGFTWAMAAVGGTNICLRKLDPKTVHGLIEQHNVTHMCGAPVVLNMLANSPDFPPLKKPVKILTAGSQPPAPVLERTESKGFLASHGYGLTETGGLVVSCAWKPEWDGLPKTERAKLKARQGLRHVGFTDLDVVDPKTGESVERDGKTVGEVVLRGGSVMLGYFKDPKATAKSMPVPKGVERDGETVRKVFIRGGMVMFGCLEDPGATAKCIPENGWFYTGDVGVMHEDGYCFYFPSFPQLKCYSLDRTSYSDYRYLEIKDRSKDVIISGGENISSPEVESVLYSNPAVNEAAVVAKPDEFWGETPCAFVSLKKGLSEKPSEKEMIKYCRERLPHFMVPKTVVFHDELPKTSTGKIQKYLLRKIAKEMEA